MNRHFTPDRPNELGGADITNVRTFSGRRDAALVLDAHSRMIVGWQFSTRLYTDLAFDALWTGIWRRERAGHDLAGFKHHSERGIQYRAIRYADRLSECDVVASVRSRGDSYEAMAEAFGDIFEACTGAAIPHPRRQPRLHRGSSYRHGWQPKNQKPGIYTRR